MKYEKNQYTEGVTFCGAIIIGALIYWGITSFIPYDPVNSWWGLFPLVCGIIFLTGGIVALSKRGKLKRMVLYEFASNPDTTIEEVAQKTGITRKDVRAIVLDLKASGELRGKFSSTTGQIKHIFFFIMTLKEAKQKIYASGFVANSKMNFFRPYS